MKLGVIAFLSLGALPSCEHGDVAIRASRTVTLEFRSDSVRSFNPGIYGFNPGLMEGFSVFKDSTLGPLASALRPGGLRFPGGNPANFYHWARGGFDETEIRASTSEAYGKRLIAQLRDLRTRQGNELSFEEFMGTANRLGILPTVVVNLVTGSPAESAAWVAAAAEKGYRVAGWELGNEPYTRLHRAFFPDAETYLAVAEQHARAMRAVDPDVRLGISVSPVGFKPEVEQAAFFRAWDRAVAETDFFDAYVVHFYPMDRNRTGPYRENDRETLFRASEFGVADALDYYSRLVPDKPAWVTEWNMMGPVNRRAHTQLHALYAGDFFISLARNSDRIEIADYHSLTGLDGSYPLFGRVRTTDGRQSGVVWREYFAFRMIGDAAAGAQGLVVPSLVSGSYPGTSNAEGGRRLSTVNALGLFSSRGWSVLVTNRTGDIVPLVLRMDGMDVFAQAAECLTDSDLASIDRVAPGTLSNRRGQIFVALDIDGQIQLPPSSLCTVEIGEAVN